MKRTGFVVGIDPDVSKSGFALLDCEAREFTQVEALTFPAVIDRFAELAASKVDGKDTAEGHLHGVFSLSFVFACITLRL